MSSMQILLNGVVLGGLYAAIAVGFSLVWGVLNIINILHGSFIVLGAYVALLAQQLLGLHPLLAVPLAGAALFVLGYALQVSIINRVVGGTVLMTLTLTFGLNLLVENAVIIGFSADYRKVGLSSLVGVLDLGGLSLPIDRLFCVVLAVILVVGLHLVLTKTQSGRAIVAVRMDRDAAALMGIDVARVYGLTFGLGACLAGAAGALLGAIFPFSPLSGAVYLGKAFVICVLGGLGSVPGVLVGGVALGLLESIGAAALGPEHATTLAFVVLLVLLRFRPQGIMGRKGYQ